VADTIQDNPQALSKTETRRAAIIQLLMENVTLKIKDLAEKFDVSLMTMHRDLTDLQKQGLVRRLRGSVSAEKSMLFESSWLYRMRQHIAEKRRLAKAAIAHIEPGNAIIWDDSTTTFQVTEFIQQVAPLTILTNSFAVLERLRDADDVDLIALGGKYNRAYNGFFGLACERTIHSCRVDVAMMSTTTVQGLSLFTQDEELLRVKRAMIEVAHKKILLVDHSKFTYSALNHVADLVDFDVVLVPETTDSAIVERLRKARVKLQLV
jgi:DeoR/GlpR family transcriptional regulator of sugar metabolism